MLERVWWGWLYRFRAFARIGQLELEIARLAREHREQARETGERLAAIGDKADSADRTLRAMYVCANCRGAFRPSSAAPDAVLAYVTPGPPSKNVPVCRSCAPLVKARGWRRATPTTTGEEVTA